MGEDFNQVPLTSDVQSFHYINDILFVGKREAPVSTALSDLSSRLCQ